MTYPLTIIGAGDLGQRVAARRCARGQPVLALRRHPPRETAVEGLQWQALDLLSGAGIDRLPRALPAMLIAVAPDRRDETAYHALYCEGLARLFAQVTRIDRLLFVSSTAVYGEDDGEWVDEYTSPRPTAFNGRILLEAEKQARAAAQETCVLRLSGLYGPGRDALHRRALGDQPGEARWSNRIHIEDATSAIDLLLDLPEWPALLLVSDDAPVRQDELIDALRTEAGLPKWPRQGSTARGRRIRNRNLRALGWRPRYPSWREGYGIKG